MERYDDQSRNNLRKRAVPPADLPDRFGERAGHRLLPGIRDPFFRFSISESRRAAASCPRASSAGIAPGPGISAAVRSAAATAVGRAHRLILLMRVASGEPGAPRPAA